MLEGSETELSWHRVDSRFIHEDDTDGSSGVQYNTAHVDDLLSQRQRPRGSGARSTLFGALSQISLHCLLDVVAKTAVDMPVWLLENRCL